MELNLTFKENISRICSAKNIEKRNEQFIRYILDKLNNISNIVVNESSNKIFLELIDKTNENYYKSYMVAYVFEIFSQFHDKDENTLNKCNLVVRIYNKDIPLFEIFSI